MCEIQYVYHSIVLKHFKKQLLLEGISFLCISMYIHVHTGWFFERGPILFLNISNTNWGTTKYHSLKEAEIHRILFDTGVEEIRSLLFSLYALEQIWSASLKCIKSVCTSLTHSLTHSATHSLTHSPTHFHALKWSWPNLL